MQSIIDFKFLGENAYLLSDAPNKTFYLYSELKAGKSPNMPKRAPLNISLVVDRSGSMGGEKIAYVRKAIQFVIENLNADDFISIVLYDDQVEVLIPSARLDKKDQLLKKVSLIKERGMTNLSGGMLEGYNQVKSTQKSGYVNRVLLLSDGLANQGVTQPDGLQRIAQTKFREEGIGLSTFGVGADFNEVLMTNLSEYGGANYYFIDSPDKIPQIFAEELEGLLSVVAQNTQMIIDFPVEYFQFEKAYGYNVEAKGAQLLVNFNDVFSDEKKAVLFKFVNTKGFSEGVRFVARLAYDDVSQSYQRETIDLQVLLRATKDPSFTSQNVNHEVLQQIALFVSNEMFEEVIRLADRHQVEEAKAKLQVVKTFLDTHFKTIPITEELKRQYEEILRYAEQLEQMHNMSQIDFMMSQKAARNISYQSRKKR